jgi:diguanylate cyclase (GGDEF)-like protein
MTGLANTDIADPIIGLVAAIIVAGVLTAWALRSASKQRSMADPLSGLFTPERFEAEIEATERRITPIKPRGAVLRGNIDHLSQVRALWGPETRADAAAKVAQIIRAGVRKGDAVSQYEGHEGDGSFVIIAPGATEEEGSAIAKRLLKTIGSTAIDGMGDDMRLSASFGVAARRIGESEAAWHARAGEALNAATEMGAEQVMAASDWEEVVMLPAPSNYCTETAPSKNGAPKAA